MIKKETEKKNQLPTLSYFGFVIIIPWLDSNITHLRLMIGKQNQFTFSSAAMEDGRNEK